MERTGPNCGKYVRKGDKLYIEGKIRSRSYDDQNGIKRTIVEILLIIWRCWPRVTPRSNRVQDMYRRHKRYPGSRCLHKRLCNNSKPRIIVWRTIYLLIKRTWCLTKTRFLGPWLVFMPLGGFIWRCNRNSSYHGSYHSYLVSCFIVVCLRLCVCFGNSFLFPFTCWFKWDRGRKTYFGQAYQRPAEWFRTLVSDYSYL